MVPFEALSKWATLGSAPLGALGATPRLVRAACTKASRAPLSTQTSPALSLRSINPSVVRAKYAVRGPLLARAVEIERDLADPARRGTYPFDSVVKCNIGNPQALGQRAPRFAREVLALTLLGDDAPDDGFFSAEARRRAAAYRAAMTRGAVGAYSESTGLRAIREEVAAFIEARDGYPADPDSIQLTDGASAAVHRVLSLVLGAETDALLVPYPQYPLYSAVTCLDKGALVPYYLDEDAGWSIDDKELDAAYERAVAKDGVVPKALVVINPGNPTGASLDRATLEAVVKFCQRRGVALLADEVYQANVYGDAPPFVSLKRVVRDLGVDDVPLFSFHSVSKGFTGECGLRGGYVEVCNLDTDVHAQLDKLASINLCSNVVGQLAVGLMVHPPEGQAEKAAYDADRQAVLASLERRSRTVAHTLDALPGITCPPASGALYVFPRLDLPRRAVDAATDAGLAPDAFYARELLEKTGLVVVPGSGFGQREGTYHIRVAFLPSEAEIDGVMARLVDFHRAFMEEYAPGDDDHHDDDDLQSRVAHA